LGVARGWAADGGQEIGTSEVTSGSCPQKSDPFDLRLEQLEEAKENKVGITSRDSQELNTLASRDPIPNNVPRGTLRPGFDAPPPKRIPKSVPRGTFQKHIRLGVFHVEHFCGRSRRKQL
jgi:hypothetical protein